MQCYVQDPPAQTTQAHKVKVRPKQMCLECFAEDGVRSTTEATEQESQHC